MREDPNKNHDRSRFPAASEATVCELERLAAWRSLRAVLEEHGVPTVGARAEVTRDGGHLLVQLASATPLSTEIASAASLRAALSVRRVDRSAALIDVAVRTAGVHGGAALAK